MKNNTLITATLIATGLGLLVGYLVWGGSEMSQSRMSTTGGHMMPNGQTMGGDMMEGSEMQGMMDDMMANLKGKTGAEFDKAFLAEMIVHHQGAVEMAQAVLKNSNRPELIQLANDIMTTQRKEINMMQTWQKSWYNQ